MPWFPLCNLILIQSSQSRACQRSHWQSHKLICESQYLILLTLKWLGPEIETAFNSFAKFSKNISGYLEKPAISALELWRDKGRVGESLCICLVFFRIVERSISFSFLTQIIMYFYSVYEERRRFFQMVRPKMGIEDVIPIKSFPPNPCPCTPCTISSTIDPVPTPLPQ